MKSDPSLILNRSDFIFPYFFGSSWIRPFVMYAPLLSLVTCSLRQTTSSWWIIYVFKELTHMKCKIGQLWPRKNKNNRSKNLNGRIWAVCPSVKKSLVFIRACPYIRAFWQNRPYFARIFVILPVFLWFCAG